MILTVMADPLEDHLADHLLGSHTILGYRIHTHLHHW